MEKDLGSAEPQAFERTHVYEAKKKRKHIKCIRLKALRTSLAAGMVRWDVSLRSLGSQLRVFWNLTHYIVFSFP